MEMRDFRARNEMALNRYWADDKDAALSLKAMMEARVKAIESEAEAA
jgi:hypothetical protein